MKIVDNIEISYFRSFEKESIKDLKDLTILSWKNDSWKSNILRALNLFFNGEIEPWVSLDFKRDFAVERYETIKSTLRSKQFISVKLTFNNINNRSNLPKKFSVNRIWDRTGKLIQESNDLKTRLKRNPSRKDNAQLTMFLNKIQFIYIPVWKSKDSYNRVFDLLYGVLVDDIKSWNIDSWWKTLVDEIESNVSQVGQYVKESIGIDTAIRWPLDLQDILRWFHVNTKSASYNISLDSRGDWIKSHYIPSILNYIAANSKRRLIRCIDEPENSCEYALTYKLATDIRDNFTKNAQIFLVSHSFQYVSLDWHNIAKYRISKQVWKIRSKIAKVWLDTLELQEDLWVLNLNEDLSRVYDQYKSLYEETEQIRRDILIDKDIIYIVCEGKWFDHEVLSFLFDKMWSWRRSSYAFVILDHVASSAQWVREHVIHLAWSPSSSNKIIWLFDNDCAGFQAFDQLNRTITSKWLIGVKWLLLPDLTWANSFNVSVESINWWSPVPMNLNKQALPLEMYLWENVRSSLWEIYFDSNHNALPKLNKDNLQNRRKEIVKDPDFDWNIFDYSDINLIKDALTSIIF